MTPIAVGRRGSRTTLHAWPVVALAVAVALAGVPAGNAEENPEQRAEREHREKHRTNKAEESRLEAEKKAAGGVAVPVGQDHFDDGAGKNPGNIGDQIKDLGQKKAKTVTQANPSTREKPPAPPSKVSAVMNDEDFVDALLQAASTSGYGQGNATDPHDAQTQLEWDKAVQHEHDVQKHLEHEFLRLQKDVATAMNAYLAAASAWQEKFAMVSSATTGLQGLMEQWAESKATLEKADFAFAMANLGVGGVKLGYKIFKWITKPKTGAVIAETVAAASHAGGGAQAGGQGAAAVEAVSTGGAAVEGSSAVKTAATATDAGANLSKTQKLGKLNAAVPVEPNQMFAPYKNVTAADTLVVGVPSPSLKTAQAQWFQQVKKVEGLRKWADGKGDVKLAQQLEVELQKLLKAKPGANTQAAAGATDDATKLAMLQAEWEAQVAKAQSDIVKAKNAGAPQSFLDTAQGALDDLLKQGKPTSVPKPPLTPVEQAKNALDPTILQVAEEAGVDTKGTIAQLAKKVSSEAVDQAEWALLHATAKAKGWHDMPTWAFNAIVNTLIEVRQVLAGVQGATLSAAKLKTVKAIKANIESQGLNFEKWLATFGGESDVVSEISFVKWSINQKEKVAVTEGIALVFDAADIKLLNNALEANGDIARLRKLASPIEQLSLNALAQADAATKIPGIGSKIASTAGPFVQANQLGSAHVLTKPTDQQLQNVMHGTGALGQVGLVHVIDEFGVVDRTKDKNLFKAAVGELWEFVTSPSATAGSYYFTWIAQDELESLLANHKGDVMQLGTLLDQAASSLGNLQRALQTAGVANEGSYLNKGGPDELKKILDDLDKAFGSGSDGWRKDHKSQYDERVAHIRQKVADLADAMQDLTALAARMQNVRQWLDSVRLNYDHTVKTPLEAFHPQVFVRLASISLYLRGMAGAAFGLTEDKPFHVVPSGEMKPKATHVVQKAGAK